MINEISIKNQNQNTNLEVNDQINEKKDLKNQRFNRINKEKETKRIEKTVEETTIIKQSDLVNPLENERNAFHFRVHVTGYIESGYFYDGDAIYCKYDFVSGVDWTQEDGVLNGQTQYSCRGESDNDYMVWNMPFEISYRSVNPSGWPQIVITCVSPNFFGDELIKGYGVVHVPTTPGRHERTVHVFSPITSSVLNGFLGLLKGKKAEIIDAPKVIASGDGREITRTKTEGYIRIVFQVTMRDMDKFGFMIN